MPERKYSADGSYRYGFNGKENDNEVKGEGEQQDYGMRIYDPRLGRFLSTDPLSKSYPFYTPYQYSGNNPILSVDIDGLEGDNNPNNVEKKEPYWGTTKGDKDFITADSKSLTLPANSYYETYESNTDYYITGTQKKISVVPGQLRNFDYNGSVYRASWNSDGSFAGYLDHHGNSVLQEVKINMPSVESYSQTEPLLLQTTRAAAFSFGWDASVRVNSYIKPMFGETLTQFHAGEISANSASIRRYFFEMDARSKLTPWARKFSQFLKSDALAYDQTARFLNTSATAQNASKIFKLRPWVNTSARILRVTGPIVMWGTQIYSYYTIVRDRKDFNQVSDELNTPFNPSYWIYRKTIGRVLNKIAGGD